jgi:hypothetical protein
MSHQPAQAAVPISSEQVLSVQTEFPEKFIPQLSPPSAGKKMAVPPKVQMPKSPRSQFSAGKNFVQKELPPKAHSQLQLARAKLKEGLAVVLSMDSDHQFGQKSSGNVPALGSAGGNMQAAGGRTQGSTTAFLDAGKDNAGNVKKVATTRSDHTEISHVPLENKVSGNGSVALDDLLQDQGLCWAPDTFVGPSESMSQPNRKRARTSDVNPGVNASERPRV